MTRVCVYCGSSNLVDPVYLDAAGRLGEVLAARNIEIVYGGGSVGLMGRLADSAMKAGGRVIGIIPKFMDDIEWSHKGISELITTDGMHQRKAWLLRDSDAVIALPGGCGTLEELFEAMTFKRLGQFLGPIVLVNIKGYYDRFNDLVMHCISENFMDQRHTEMWQTVDRPEDVPRRRTLCRLRPPHPGDEPR